MSPRKGKTEREHIQWMIRGARYSDNVSEMKNFLNLEMMMLEPHIYDLDLSDNQGLWDEFKDMLQEHPLLEEDKEAYQRLNQPDMVKKGYWWYDPESWKK